MVKIITLIFFAIKIIEMHRQIVKLTVNQSREKTDIHRSQYYGNVSSIEMVTEKIALTQQEQREFDVQNCI